MIKNLGNLRGKRPLEIVNKTHRSHRRPVYPAGQAVQVISPSNANWHVGLNLKIFTSLIENQLNINN